VKQGPGGASHIQRLSRFRVKEPRILQGQFLEAQNGFLIGLFLGQVISAVGLPVPGGNGSGGGLGVDLYQPAAGAADIAEAPGLFGTGKMGKEFLPPAEGAGNGRLLFL
jgi:hypothetical protein